MRKLHKKSLKDVKTVCYFIKSFSCLIFFFYYLSIQKIIIIFAAQKCITYN